MGPRLDNEHREPAASHAGKRRDDGKEGQARHQRRQVRAPDHHERDQGQHDSERPVEELGQDQGRAAHDLIPQVRSSDSRRAPSFGQQPEAAPPCPFADHSSQHQFNLKQTLSKLLSLPARAAPPDARGHG